MRYMDAYVLSYTVLGLHTKLSLKELTIYIYESMKPATMRSEKKFQEIDIIWGSQEISITQGVYITYHCGPKYYYSLLWINIQQSVELRDNNAPFRELAQRKLILHHPRGYRKYD